MTPNETILTCEAFGEALDAYLADRLPAEARRSFRRHLATCPTCRGLAERKEPTLIFAGLGEPGRDEEMRGRVEPAAPSADVEAFVAGVRRGIALREAERRAQSRPNLPRLLKLAAVVGFVALGGSFLLRLAWPPEGIRQLRSAGSAAVSSSVVASARAGSVGEAGAVPAIEGLDRRDARIYDLELGGEEEPRVVLIVDEGMDL